jgi:hypothetical protein
VLYFLQNPSFANDIVCKVCPYALDFADVFEGEDFLCLFFGTFQFDDSDLSTDEIMLREEAKREGLPCHTIPCQQHAAA